MADNIGQSLIISVFITFRLLDEAILYLLDTLKYTNDIFMTCSLSYKKAIGNISKGTKGYTLVENWIAIPISHYTF